MKKTKTLGLIGIILLVLLVQTLIITGLTFTSNPWVDNNTRSDQDVTCFWDVSADTTQTNVSWYNQSNLMSTQTLTPDIKSAVLSKTYTQRGEVWSCNLTISNGTDSLNRGYSLVIKNANPTNIKLYNTSNNLDLGNQTALNEDTTYNFYLNATDDDMDVLSYFAPNINTTGVTLSDQGVFTWKPDYFNANETNITFYAIDNYPGDPGVGAFSFSFYMNQVNDAPYFSPNLTTQSATENTPFTYQITGTDEELNYPLTFSILSNGGLSLILTTISNTSAQLNFTPTWDDRGPHSVNIEVNDSLNKSTNATFILNVNTVNQAPTITYLENSSGTQGEAFSFMINATDKDDDNLTFNITAYNCSNPSIWNITQLITGQNVSGIIDVISLTNNHILCKQVTISVTDTKITVRQNVTLNLTNTNDPPIIFETSAYPTNTNDNTNLTNLTGFLLVEFRYKINYTDPDLLLDQNENLTISSNVTNATLFTINNQTGDIIFTPNDSMIGSHQILINLTDYYGQSITRIMTLTLLNNTAPALESIPNMTTLEKEEFYYKANATDPDGNTQITYSDNTTLFDIDSLTGEINFTPIQNQIGVYEIKIRATDNLEIFDEKTFTINITNKNDAPTINNISFPIIIATYAFNYTINATDEDLLLPEEYQYDNLTYWTNSTLFIINESTGNIYFTPLITDIGNHSITITVNDSQGLNDIKIYNFTIHDISLPPTIINITPHATPTTFTWANVTDVYPQKITNINLSENITITFNHTTTNPEPDETMTFRWYYDTNLVKTGNEQDKHLTRYFDYSSQGTHNLTLVADDGRYGYDSFTWLISISNLNQPIVFLNQPTNKTIAAKNIDNLFIVLNQEANRIFYDPDDPDYEDYDDLIFNYTQYSGQQNLLDISFSGSVTTFTPRETGNNELSYIFFASDGYSEAQTLPVTIIINYTKEVEVQPQPQTSRQTPQYYQVEVEKIINQEILFPKTLTLFKNNTAIIPIEIRNTGNKTLEQIELSAKTDNKEVKITFEQNMIDKINPSKTLEVNMIVESYREQGTYEIEVTAKVKNPAFTDTAIIKVDSLQKEEGDEKSTQTRLSYAKDLLSTNPKCLELNELLQEADDSLKSKDYKQAQAKIEDALKACRYLNMQKEIKEEKPDMIKVNINDIKYNKKLYYSIIGLFSISIFGLVFSVYYTNKRV